MTFDAQITSITQNYIVPSVVDSQLNGNFATLAFLANGRPWYGVTMDFPVKLASHTQGGSFNDFQEFSTANENVRQLASFDARGYYQSVVIGGIARSVNEGMSKQALLNLVKVEMESVQQDMADDIGALTYGDGTGNSSADFLGLDAGIDDGNTIATYGGISRSTYANWKSTIQGTVGAFDFSKHRTLMNSATVGNRKPTVEVCNETVFGYVEADYTATVQGNYNVLESARGVFTKNGVVPSKRDGLVGQMGFPALYFDGTPIVKDDQADSGKLYAINTDMYRWYGVKPVETEAIDLKSIYHDGNDYKDVPSSVGFGWTGFVRPAKQYAFIGQFILLGNLMTPSPRLHSVSSAITS